MYVYYFNMTIAYVRNEFNLYHFVFLDSLNNCATTMLIKTTSPHYIKCKLSTFQHINCLASPSSFSFLIENRKMKQFPPEMFGITESQDFTNSYIAALYTNGEMKLCEDGVKFICQTPEIVRIPYNCTYNMLNQKVCATIQSQAHTTINNLYFRRPTMTSEGNIVYDAFEIKTDEHVFQMLECKSSFPFNTMIELYVTFTRSPEEILSLLTTNTPSSSSSNSLPTSPTILYYGGPLRGAGIKESRSGFGFEFRSDATKTFSIRHDCTYNELLQTVTQLVECGDRRVVKQIDYRRPSTIHNRRLFHDTAEIKCDFDVSQMINRWKHVQSLDQSVKKPRISSYIELFIQTRDIRPPTPFEEYQDINSGWFVDHRGRRRYRWLP